jgi:hypothetical protein
LVTRAESAIWLITIQRNADLEVEVGIRATRMEMPGNA